MVSFLFIAAPIKTWSAYFWRVSNISILLLCQFLRFGLLLHPVLGVEFSNFLGSYFPAYTFNL